MRLLLVLLLSVLLLLGLLVVLLRGLLRMLVVLLLGRLLHMLLLWLSMLWLRLLSVLLFFRWLGLLLFVLCERRNDRPERHHQDCCSKGSKYCHWDCLNCRLGLVAADSCILLTAAGSAQSSRLRCNLAL